MSAAAAFLGGAGGRLLPVSVPLRFFAAAAAFHLLAWLALLAGWDQVAEFRGGLGWPLAALHLLTLGVFGMTALGAGAQLLPVATRQAAMGARWLAAVWWLYTPGVAVLALGMGLADARLLAAGAVAVASALLAWAALMARTMAGARGMPGVLAHAWVALASLVVLLATALSLAGTWLGWAAPPRDAALALHVVFAPFGFMGGLALGISYILVPMFAMSDPPSPAAQLASLGLAATALACAAVAVLGLVPGLFHAVAWGCGTSAVLLHLHLMRGVLAQGMRRKLGTSFRLVKLGWGGLLAAMVLAAVLWLDLPLARAQAWFGLAVAGVWLLSFVLGILQRILPFLASLHLGRRGGRRPPTASALTHERAASMHFRCHVGALALLAAAIATGSGVLVALAAACGAAGASAFARFCVHALLRLKAAPG